MIQTLSMPMTFALPTLSQAKGSSAIDLHLRGGLTSKSWRSSAPGFRSRSRRVGPAVEQQPHLRDEVVVRVQDDARTR